MDLIEQDIAAHSAIIDSNPNVSSGVEWLSVIIDDVPRLPKLVGSADAVVNQIWLQWRRL